MSQKAHYKGLNILGKHTYFNIINASMKIKKKLVWNISKNSINLSGCLNLCIRQQIFPRTTFCERLRAYVV